MVATVPKSVYKLWEKWNIRGVILLSLSLQIILIFLAPLRKRTQRSWVVISIWSAYLLADWAANFCVGLIASNQYYDPTSTGTNTESYLLAFWAPFLLLHLGGPDTITAFALEDNELWLRHLFGFIFQVASICYVFFQTVPGNTLWIPTVLVFLAGTIKYAERTCALYLASMENFGQSESEGNEGNTPTELAKVPERYPLRSVQEQLNELGDAEVMLYAYYLFTKFKGIVVEKIFRWQDNRESKTFFCVVNAESALKVMEVEFNFIYDAFFTKFSVLCNNFGYLFRFIAISSVVVALVLFSIIDKEKQGFEDFDVKLTYSLLYGAVALDAMAILMLILSDQTLAEFLLKLYTPSSSSHSFAINLSKYLLQLQRPRWLPWEKEYFKYSTLFLFRRWNGSVSGCNLIDYCLKHCPSPKERKNWKRMLYFMERVIIKHHHKGLGLVMWLNMGKNPFIKELWEFIFNELKRKTDQAERETLPNQMSRIFSARGERAVKESGYQDQLGYFVVSANFSFDESLIMWHIATHLCYEEDHNNHDKKRQFSKFLSDYMLYLLVVQSNIISGVSDTTKKRFQSSCVEVINIFRTTSIPDCTILLQESPIDRDYNNFLLDACALAKYLIGLPEERKWETISKVWVELLSFAAYKTRPTVHVQQLSKGGQLISLVWLLMVHLGPAMQLPSMNFFPERSSTS